MLGTPLAAGGMSSVHLGRLDGADGFKRVVAIKRMHEGARARNVLHDEARLASRIQHRNVVQTLDVVEQGDELFLVLEYVEGESLDQLLGLAAAQRARMPPAVAVAIITGVLRGLQAAHEARGDDGKPLELVHRDMSPHNVIVDVYGTSRVLDFGVARARGRLQVTREGQLKGKLAYLSPEQVHGDATVRSDLFAAGVVLWECLAGRQLFAAETEGAVLGHVLMCRVPPLADFGVEAPGVQAVLDRVLVQDPAGRYATATEMADQLEACGAATPAEVAAWVSTIAAHPLALRREAVESLEGTVASKSMENPMPPLSLENPLPPLRREPPRPLPMLLGVLVGLLGVGVVVWSRGEQPQVRPAEQVARPQVPPLTEFARVDPAPVPDAIPDSPSDSVPPQVRPVEDAPKVSKPPRISSVRITHPHRPARDCTPPFVIDSKGVKHFKVECL